MTDQELKDLVASLAIGNASLREAQRITDLQIKELRETLAQYSEEAKEERRKTEEESRKTERHLRELGKQIGGLGNKFGAFTEGLSLDSVHRLLVKRFKIDEFTKGEIIRKNGDSIELDGLGIANGTRNEAYLVEVKSNFRLEDIKQMQDHIAKFRTMFPQYQKFKIFGIIAFADGSAEAITKAQKAGFGLVSFSDSLMRWRSPKGFQMKAF